MGLPILWIEKIFSRLAVAYGQDFLNRWRGIPISDVKADWSSCLAGFSDNPRSIAFALENLPDSKPPTAQEFRAICRQAPSQAPLMIQASKADYKVVADAIKSMGAGSISAQSGDSKRDHKMWAKRLKDRHDRGEKLALFQVNAYKKALYISA
jgi:hypothetical protein